MSTQLEKKAQFEKKKNTALSLARSDPAKVCGHPVGQDDFCSNWAGYDTDHKGYGFCAIHDSLPEIPADPAYVLPDIFNLTREIIITRQAIIRLSRSKHPFAMSQLGVMVTALAKLIPAAHKVALDRRYLVELPQVVALIETIIQLGRRYIPDDYERQKFADELSKALRSLATREPRLPADSD